MEMATKKTEKPAPRAVVVTTEKGVFFGHVEDETKAPAQITLTGCRCAVYYPQATKGFLGLAASGPPAGSRIGPAAPRVTVYALTSIAECSGEAVSAWEKAVWA
jgi:hypothetical protein